MFRIALVFQNLTIAQLSCSISNCLQTVKCTGQKCKLMIIAAVTVLHFIRFPTHHSAPPSTEFF